MRPASEFPGAMSRNVVNGGLTRDGTVANRCHPECSGILRCSSSYRRAGARNPRNVINCSFLQMRNTAMFGHANIFRLG